MAWGPEMPTRSALAAAGPLPCREATALGAMDGPEGRVFLLTSAGKQAMRIRKPLMGVKRIMNEQHPSPAAPLCRVLSETLNATSTWCKASMS